MYPPQRDLGAEVVKDMPSFEADQWSFLVLELTKLGEDLFFFGDHLILAGKVT